jgi:hypothetical protein
MWHISNWHVKWNSSDVRAGENSSISDVRAGENSSSSVRNDAEDPAQDCGTCNTEGTRFW